jgi:23S rRNA (uracil1939-C5)-methyltransferase
MFIQGRALKNMNRKKIAPCGRTRQYEIAIEKLVPGGNGMGRINNKVIFVPGVIPGETVKAEIIEDKKGLFFGKVIRIICPSPSRRTPPCPLADTCGGCNWQHMTYEEQSRQKVLIARDCFRRTAGTQPPEIEIIQGPGLGYRNRVQFHRDEKGNIGYMARDSNNVVPVNRCPVVIERINEFLSRPPEGNRPRFTVFAGNGWIASEEDEDKRDLSVTLSGREISFNVMSFFQSNLVMLEKLVQYIAGGLEGNVLLDLYSGVGVFGASLGVHFKKIIAVDENPISVNYAAVNITGENNEFYGMSVEDWIGSLRKPVQAETVIVDPPRTGLGRKVRVFLNEIRPHNIMYVSCDIATFARDIKDFLEGGYRIRDVVIFDFYPQTSHIESLALLSRE